MTLAEAKERIRKLEELLGDPPEGYSGLVSVVMEQADRILSQQNLLRDLTRDMDLRVGTLKLQNSEALAAQEERLLTIETEIKLLRRAAVLIPEETAVSKLKVPEPKPFNGSRNAKELENFLWDMEQYFRAARVPEMEQVSITPMYLVGDAKLWWRTRMEDDRSANRPGISTWEMLKKELKDQFLPCNTAWMARESLKRLKQTGSIREYVKEFSSLMLDIKNMSEEDKLFNFMSGLQGWAQAELRRQGVRDIPSAMAAAEGLIDYRMTNTTSGPEKKKFGEAKKGKNQQSKKRFEEKKKKEYQGRDHGQGKPKPQSGCFICGGPHRARECPKREKLTAMVSEEATGAEAGPSHVNPLLLINTITNNKPADFRNLLYCLVQINGKEVRAMLDTGATNNFVAKREAERLGLQMLDSSSTIKAVNSGAMPVFGAAETVLAVGAWRGRCRMMVVPLDDFDLILGMEFFMKAKVMLLPHLKGIVIGDEANPCFVSVEGGKHEGNRNKVAAISAKQLDKGLKHGEETYLAALVQVKPDMLVEVPDQVANILEEFADVMPAQLPRELPPRRVVDHRIELEAGAKPPARAPYRMAPCELMELRRQLDELLEAGMVQWWGNQRPPSTF